jgi:hypothetical protein
MPRANRLRRATRALLLASLAAALVAAAYWMRAGQATVAANADCGVLDHAASLRVALLIGDDSAAADRRLDEALAQLRRARKYCRSGFIAVAAGDYRALERAIPGDVTASTPNR